MIMKRTMLVAAALGWVVTLVPAASRAQDATTAEAALAKRQAERWPILGAMVDVGVPDGVIGSLVARPWHWLRCYGGGGSNSVSKGWRLGTALIPFGSGPALSLEYGGYGQGDANDLAKKLAGGEFEGSPLLSKLSYRYANAHVGLEFGGKWFTFFVHGGLSMVWAQLHSGGTLTGTGSDTVVSINQDPKVKAVGSSIKLGLILFVL
jgi:hypothetical protein